MDDREGHFRPLTEKEMLEIQTSTIANMPHFFVVGEEVELKGSRFRVKAIKRKELRLRLLPAASPAMPKLRME